MHGVGQLGVADSAAVLDRLHGLNGRQQEKEGGCREIRFTPAIPNLEGCPYSAGDEVIIDWTTDPNAKAMYATALAAYLAGQKVGFGVSGCYPGSAPLAYRVDVKP